MPRIYASNNDPYDFCVKCFPHEDEAQELYGKLGDGPDDRGNCYGYDEGHPPYEGEDYHCENCKRLLTEADDSPY